MPSNQLVAIVGFMGCGKTAVARSVAAELNRKMVDLDDLITERYGRTPAEIILNDSELTFRSIETGMLGDLLASGFAGVVSLGGGAWVESANRKLLAEKEALAVWLDTPFDLCWQRIESAKEIRPLAPTRDEAKLLFERRRPVYELADIHVTSSIDETVETLMARVKAAIEMSDTV